MKRLSMIVLLLAIAFSSIGWLDWMTAWIEGNKYLPKQQICELNNRIARNREYLTRAQELGLRTDYLKLAITRQTLTRDYLAGLEPTKKVTCLSGGSMLTDACPAWNSACLSPAT